MTIAKLESYCKLMWKIVPPILDTDEKNTIKNYSNYTREDEDEDAINDNIETVSDSQIRPFKSLIAGSDEIRVSM